MKTNIFIVTSLLLMFASCKKDDASEFNNNIKSDMTIEFDNVVGSSNLELGAGNYTNAVGEQFKVTQLKYYISNISLTNIDGSVYTVPQNQSYFLVNEADVTTRMPKISVPEGEYKAVKFTIGVDSVRSTKDIAERTGVLDPVIGGMYWSWNSGYIFFRMEGTSPASVAAGNAFRFHIGGYGGYSSPTINNLKNINIDLSSRGNVKVKTGKVPNIHLLVDVLKAMNGTTNVSLAANNTVMFSAYSTNIANNYASMFSHDHTEN